jgi:pimeloyl-ACP methyl ester carboxylesterase
MPQKRTIDWWDVDKLQSDLETFPPPVGAQDVEHRIQVQREAIPLVFIPGIMGSRLRLAGTDGTGKGPGGLPNLRWDPGAAGFMAANYLWRGPERRRRMIIGTPEQDFDPGYLEVDNTDPYGDGFAGLMGYQGQGKKGSAYLSFLTPLKTHDWGPLSKIFEFPVYGIGYNWSDDPENAGQWIAKKIAAIIEESKNVTGRCEKVILITHSMGGLVARAASELCGARSSILGIVHGVQPATGAPAAYWRMKAGFEGGIIGLEQSVLGNSGPNVTCILGNMPGGLALLPTKNHTDNHNRKAWLKIRDNGRVIFAAPQEDPYEEIYRAKAEVEPLDDEMAPSGNKYWGLVDENLLNPENQPPGGKNDNDALDAASGGSAWDQYLSVLGIAESFHDNLKLQAHPRTLCLHGTGRDTADIVELHVESRWFKRTSYPTQGFRGYFTDSGGNKKIAVLQGSKRQDDGTDDGDGTVTVSSATALNAKARPSPGDTAAGVDHQPAFESAAVQDWAIQAIATICKLRYYEKRGGAAGDFPPPSSNSATA